MPKSTNSRASRQASSEPKSSTKLAARCRNLARIFLFPLPADRPAPARERRTQGACQEACEGGNFARGLSPPGSRSSAPKYHASENATGQKGEGTGNHEGAKEQAEHGFAVPHHIVPAREGDAER